jgi:CDP-paratose 2-epimerase
MNTAIITGSAGLIGSESVRFFARQGFKIIGIDNDMRAYFFGPEASTGKNRDNLIREVSDYEHVACDIRDYKALEQVFNKYNSISNW